MIFISYPIINANHDYLVLVAASIPAVTFFDHYGNLSNSQFFSAYDKNGTILADTENPKLVGHNFFGNNSQLFIDHNRILNNLTRSLLNGNSGFNVYDFGRGERFTTGYPVLVQDKPAYFIQVSTLTPTIYSPLQDILFTERVKMLSLLGVTMASITVLIAFLIKWSDTLAKEAKRRAADLLESERRAKALEDSYDQMKLYLDEVIKEVQRGK